MRNGDRGTWQPGRILTLTGIRGVAACWVMMFHAFITFGEFAVRPEFVHVPVVGRGYLAVDLFFVLSGYILALSYAGRFRQEGRSAALDFAVGRIFRIMPLNMVALALFAGAVLCFGARFYSSERLEVPSFVASVILVQAWGPFSPTAWNYPAWSLSAEWLAYLGFPVGLLVLERTSRASVALAGALACLALLAAIMAAVGDGHLDHVWRLGIVRCLLEFAAGMFLWRWYDLRSASLARPDLWAVAAFALLAVALIGPWWELLAPFAFALLIVVCAQGSRLTEALFANRVSVHLGDVSFSIYLLHVIVIGTCHVIADAIGLSASSPFVQYGFLAVMLSIVILIAHFGWHFVEVPGNAFGRRFGASRTVARESAS